MELIERVVQITEQEGADIYWGRGASYGSDVTAFCELLRQAITQCRQDAESAGSDLSSGTYQIFVKRTIPRAIEILCKRATKIEHECAVLGTLEAFMEWAAAPALQRLDEICAARNIALLGSSDLRFISTKELGGGRGAAVVDTGLNFALTHGKPAAAFLGCKIRFFWRDEWQSVLGAQRAVGHLVSYLHDNGLWYLGEVCRFDERTGQHTLRLEESQSQLALECNMVDINIDTSGSRIQWVDSGNIARLQASLPTDGGRPGAPDARETLTFSSKDEGRYVMIWWPRYNRNFYGKIQAYDPISREHKVVYQDGDIKCYDMAHKLYEILRPPTVVISRAAVDAPHQAAATVAAWHTEQLRRANDCAWIQNAAAPAIYVDGNLHRDKICIRGTAHAGSDSCFRSTLVNVFYRCGGFDSIFLVLSNAKTNPLPISCILSHLRLAVQLKKAMLADSFAKISWELKEGVPYAFFNATGEEIKRLDTAQYTELCDLLSELINYHLPASPSRNTMLELFRLDVGLKLLKCSQLKKRFWGLSVICDRINSIYPVVSDYLTQISDANDRTKPSWHRYASECEASNASTRRDHLSAQDMDIWLSKHDILDVVFVQSFHQDLSARCDIVLVYMAMRRILSATHLDAVWSAASGGRHEAVVRVLHNLIVRVVPVLGPELRQHLFGLICLVPFTEYSEQMLRLLKSFTVTCMSASLCDETKDYISTKQCRVGNPDSFSEITWRSVDPSAAATATHCDADVVSIHGCSRPPQVIHSRKGQVIGAPSRPWLGLGLLWKFLQDRDSEGKCDTDKPNTVVADINLIDLAVHLFVELLNDEFSHEREVVVQKCVENVHNSVSVPTSLSILHLVFSSYRSTPKGWFGRGAKDATIAVVLDNLNDIVGGNIIDLVLSELDSYLTSFRQYVDADCASAAFSHFRSLQAKGNSDLDNKRIIVRGKMCIVPHLLGIKERLSFIKFILSSSPLVLSEDNLRQLWTLLVTSAYTVKTIDVFMSWLDSLLMTDSKSLQRFLDVLIQETDAIELLKTDAGLCSSDTGPLFSYLMYEQGNRPQARPAKEKAGQQRSTESDIFGLGVAQFLLDGCMIPWARAVRWENLSRRAVATVGVKLFFFVNIKHGLLHFNSTDVSWSRSGHLIGLKLLWHLAVDSADQHVTKSAMHLLVELHYRQGPKQRATEDHPRNIFLRRCFNQLAILVHTRAEPGGTSTAPPVLVKQDSVIEDDSFETPAVITGRLLRYLSLLVLFFKRFDVELIAAAEAAPANKVKAISIRVYVGISESFLADMNARPSDTCGMLRDKISEHLQEEPYAFTVERKLKPGGLFSAGSPTYELLSLHKDEYTLAELKFSLKEVLVVKRINHSKIQEERHRTGPKSIDLIKAKDLSSAHLRRSCGVPFDWLGITRPSAQELLSPGAGKLENTSGAMSTDMKRSASSTSLSGTSAHSADTIVYEKGSNVCPTLSLFEAPAPPLPRHPEMVLIQRKQNKGDILSRGPASSLQDFLVGSLTGKPEYFDLLLNMLDGYISFEMQRMTPSGTEMAAKAWEVIQYLPCDGTLLSRLTDLNPASSSSSSSNESSVRDLFRSESPYRLLYTLQIVDSITDTESSPHVSDTSIESIHQWCITFINSGGIEYLLGIVKLHLSAIDSTPPTKPRPVSQVGCTTGCGELSFVRTEVSCLICAISFRVLRRLLVLDPAANHVWVSLESTNTSQIKMGPCTDRYCFPRGVLVALCDVPSLVPQILRCLLRVSASCNGEGTAPKEVEVLSLLEHGFSFALALCSSVDAGVLILCEFANWERLLRSLCIRNPFSGVRKGICHKILAFSYGIVLWTQTTTRNSSGDCGEPASIDNGKLGFLKFLSKSVLRCGHPYFDQEYGKVQQKAAETYLYPEFYYALVAALWSLQHSPRAAMYAAFGKLTDFLIWRNVLPSSDLTFVATSALCLAFVEKLFTHRSIESFHCSSPDRTLVGVLRILLTLSRLDPDARRLLGHCNAHITTDESGARTVRVSSARSEQTPINDPGTLMINVGGKVEVETLLHYLAYECLNPRRKSSVDCIDEGTVGIDSVTPVAGGCDENAGLDVTSFCRENNAVKSRRPHNEGRVEAQCNNVESKNLAYSLISQLCCDDVDNLKIFLENVIPDGALILARPEAYIFNNIREPSVGDIPQRAALKITKSVDKVSYLWDYNPNVLLKSDDQCVGLVNQGATCYMNALLQQLFQVQKFSSGLLSIEWEELHGFLSANCTGPDAESAIGVIFQLQVAFGYLKLSQKRFYDARPFCSVFTDYDGEPLRLGEQKDINEFASMLFDKLECNRKSADLVSACFGGKLVYQIISTESSYCSEREEEFKMITVEIKDKVSLEEALELFVAGERLSEDNKIMDDVENRKVEAIRRCAIRKLPDTLIIHLKRFEFDLTTMERKKLNDKLSFPFELDMFPYTEEGVIAREQHRRAEMCYQEVKGGPKLELKADAVAGRAHEIATPDGGASVMDIDNDLLLNHEEILLDGITTPSSVSTHPMFRGIDVNADSAAAETSNCAQYTLRGVVAHAGAIDSGHYYSFIKDRDSGVWREFNDRSVLPFSSQSIPRECFGGEDDDSRQSNVASEQKMREYSAYLLLYDRVDSASSSPVNSVVVDRTASLESEIKGSAVPFTEKLHEKKIGSLSDRVLQTVLTENIEFFKHRNMFDVSYFRFVWSFLTCDAMDLLLCREISTKSSRKSCMNSQIAIFEPCQYPNFEVARLTLWVLSFCMEVLIHARAHQCVYMYFEKLEEIVIRDKYGVAAAAILHEIGVVPRVEEQLPLTMYRMALDAAGSSGSTAQRGARASSMATEITAVESLCHPWLIEACLLCPHAATTNAFARLLLVCLKVLLPSGVSGGYLVQSSDYIRSGTCPMRRNRYLSPIARALDAVVSFLEQFRLDHIFNKNGYMQLTAMLHNFASLGAEERNLLIHIGTVNRLACSVVSLHQASCHQSLEYVASATATVSLLVRGSISFLPVADGFTECDCSEAPGDPDVAMHTLNDDVSLWRYPEVDLGDSCSTALTQEVFDGTYAAPLFQLSKYDVQAFLSTTYLEDAILTSGDATTSALLRICACNGADVCTEVLTTISNLLSRVIDYPAVTTDYKSTASKHSFRAFFKVLTSVLLFIMDPAYHFPGNIPLKSSPKHAHPRMSSDDCDVKLRVFKDVVHPLLSKCDYISNNWKRYTGIVAHYVNELCNMLLAVGLKGRAQHKLALMVREWWEKANRIVIKIHGISKHGL